MRNRVLQAIKELHYYPSDVARSLSTKKTKIVGIIISDIQNPFYGPLIRGIEEVLLKSDYNILLASNNEDPKKEKMHLKTYFSKRVDGVILTTATDDISFLQVMESVGTKIVLIDRIPQNNPYVSIVVDNRDASRKLVNHLIDDGHERIGILIGGERSTLNDRVLGYKDALVERGLQFSEEMVSYEAAQQRGGYLAAKRLLKRNPRPSAIFALNNLMTMGALFAIREMGLKCPEEIAIVGFDDTAWSPIFNPPSYDDMSAYKRNWNYRC